MNQRRWFATFAPVTTITIASIIAVGLALLSILVAIHEPWLGIEFNRNFDGPGIRVSQIKKASPSADILNVGDTILAIVTPSQQRIDLSALTILEDPDRLSSYAEYNAFFAHQQSVYQALLSPSLTAILSDERRVIIAPIKSPGVSALPGEFWWLMFFGGASFLLGVSAWSMRRKDSVARVLALSGLGFMLGAYSCGIYTARELVLPSQLFFSLAAANHLGIMVFAYASILFFWYYPSRLGKGSAAWAYLGCVATIWLNETLQLLSWPLHVFYAHFLLAYSALVCLSVLQWRKSHGNPLHRALLKWLMSTVLVSLGLTVLLFYAPVVLTGKPIASNVMTFGAVFLFYLGLVIGNIRYHQFDMDQWWIKAW